VRSNLDVAIVGGGPAGAWTAYQLARHGARVAVLDGSHPREKPCGGGVTGRALRMVHEAIADRALPEVAIEAASFAHDGRSARCELRPRDGRGRLIVTARRNFDAALLESARAAGARHIPERAVDVRAEGGGWIVATRSQDIGAEWIVAADGATSLVRRRVARPFARRDLSIAGGYFVHGATARDVDVELLNDPPGYLWSFPRADHLAVGVCAQADETTAARLQARAAAWISAHVGGDVTLERYSWPIPSLTPDALRRERPSGRGWLLVGDAAGLVDPITREGIYFALCSAEHAAASLLGGGDPAPNYAERLRASVYPELARAAKLKARFFRPPFMALLIRALTRSGAIRDVMADLVAGEQTYFGLRRRLLRTFEWRLMVELFGLRY
jgi:geranylgeranyl reductase family protein